MSEQDVKDVADEAIDKGADVAHQAARFLPLLRDVSGGMIALTAAVVAGNMALGKFRAAYETSKVVKPS